MGPTISYPHCGHCTVDVTLVLTGFAICVFGEPTRECGGDDKPEDSCRVKRPGDDIWRACGGDDSCRAPRRGGEEDSLDVGGEQVAEPALVSLIKSATSSQCIHVNPAELVLTLVNSILQRRQ